MPLQATSGAASYDGFGGGVAAVPNYIEEVFSTYLYTGNGTSQTITNGIDLAGKGGMVWNKARSSISYHDLIDSVRGINKAVYSNTTDAQATAPSGNGITSFNSDGLTFGTNYFTGMNESGVQSVLWTFRKQPKFFDVVTYTGTGSATTISHSLGSVPGCVIVKRTDDIADWAVYHNGLNGGTNPQNYRLFLNSTTAQAAQSTFWNNTAPTSTAFTVGTSASTNGSGNTYVAYVFASNAGGFGLTGTDNVISCGSFTCNASGVATVNLGYEPQWLLVKTTNTTGDWYLFDNMRGMTAAKTSSGGGVDNYLLANTSAAEVVVSDDINVTSTGFTTTGGLTATSDTFIYIAIRRGPMKVPTSGTSVFSPNAASSPSYGTVITTGFPVDMQMAFNRNTDYPQNRPVLDRLRKVSTNTTEGAVVLYTSSTNAEVTSGTDATYETLYWNNTGFSVADNQAGNSDIFYSFRRAPSFFDEVCYDGPATTSGTTTRSHNLGVTPELMIIKSRNDTFAWYVLDVVNNKRNDLTSNLFSANSSVYVSNVTSTSFDTYNNTGAVGYPAKTYVAYLFATCAGVSKVGSYTGNGSSQTINCGFTGGARFVLIKRTDSTGDWYVWDTARGIVAGNDPYLSLNTSAAEVTTDDTIDTDSTGFVVNQVAATNVNVTSATYIFLAIA